MFDEKSFSTSSFSSSSWFITIIRKVAKSIAAKLPNMYKSPLPFFRRF